jgi:methylenetetrahydrofolate dehydrogenase (NADP+) / methenyltetrahydrofolate cyclohydrolase
MSEETAAADRTNHLMDGKRIADEIVQHEIKAMVDQMAANGETIPGLAVILVGSRRDSQTYVTMKKKACAKAGIRSVGYDFNETVTELELMTCIQTLNHDDSIHGILVQLPLPTHLNTNAILESISPAKDVDGLHPVNVAALQLYKLPLASPVHHWGV